MLIDKLICLLCVWIGCWLGLGLIGCAGTVNTISLRSYIGLASHLKDNEVGVPSGLELIPPDFLEGVDEASASGQRYSKRLFDGLKIVVDGNNDDRQPVQIETKKLVYINFVSDGPMTHILFVSRKKFEELGYNPDEGQSMTQEELAVSITKLGPEPIVFRGGKDEKISQRSYIAFSYHVKDNEVGISPRLKELMPAHFLEGAVAGGGSKYGSKRLFDGLEIAVHRTEDDQQPIRMGIRKIQYVDLMNENPETPTLFISKEKFEELGYNADDSESNMAPTALTISITKFGPAPVEPENSKEEKVVPKDIPSDSRLIFLSNPRGLGPVPVFPVKLIRDKAGGLGFYVSAPHGQNQFKRIKKNIEDKVTCTICSQELNEGERAAVVGCTDPKLPTESTKKWWYANIWAPHIYHAECLNTTLESGTERKCPGCAH